MTTLTYQRTYTIIECSHKGCGVTFALSDDFIDARRRDRATWYCPNGHSRWYPGKTVEQEKKEAEARAVHLEDQLFAAKHEAERIRHALLRDRERWAKGMCPCCRRNFPALAQHVQTEHPDYDLTAIKPPKYECSCHRSFDTPRGLGIHQRARRSADWWKDDTSRYWAHLTVTD